MFFNTSYDGKKDEDPTVPSSLIHLQLHWHISARKESTWRAFCFFHAFSKYWNLISWLKIEPLSGSTVQLFLDLKKLTCAKEPLDKACEYRRSMQGT